MQCWDALLLPNFSYGRREKPKWSRSQNSKQGHDLASSTPLALASSLAVLKVICSSRSNTQ